MTPELATKSYDILVRTVGAPDLEHLRWAFERALVNVGVQRYLIDGKLGLGARFDVTGDFPCVTVVETNVARTKMCANANAALRKLFAPSRSDVETATKTAFAAILQGMEPQNILKAA